MSKSRVLALVLVGAALSLPTSAPAAVATLSVAPVPQHPDELALVSRLGAVHSGASIAFFVVTKEFGQPRDVPIGVAKVGADGTARVRYRPTWSGKQQFVAKLAGATENAPTATADYRVTVFTEGPLAGTANPSRPLASVGHVFLATILSVVALVWLSLFVTLALAFGRMPRLAGGAGDRGG